MNKVIAVGAGATAGVALNKVSDLVDRAVHKNDYDPATGKWKLTTPMGATAQSAVRSPFKRASTYIDFVGGLGAAGLAAFAFPKMDENLKLGLVAMGVTAAMGRAASIAEEYLRKAKPAAPALPYPVVGNLGVKNMRPGLPAAPVSASVNPVPNTYADLTQVLH